MHDRGKNRIELTDTGEVAVEQARSLLSEAEKAVETVQTFERNQHTITIHSCAPVPLWSLLPELSRRFPDNIISSKLTNMDEILQNVSSGNADIGILPQSCSDKNLLCIPYLKEQFYVCIPTDEFEFEELVRTSTLLCFSSSKTTDSDQTLKGRKQIPLTDPEVNVTYHLISSTKSTILQSVSPTFEFRPQK